MNSDHTTLNCQSNADMSQSLCLWSFQVCVRRINAPPPPLRVSADADVQHGRTGQQPGRGHFSADLRLVPQRLLPQREEEDPDHRGAQRPHPQILCQLSVQQPRHDLPLAVLRLQREGKTPHNELFNVETCSTGSDGTYSGIFRIIRDVRIPSSFSKLLNVDVMSWNLLCVVVETKSLLCLCFVRFEPERSRLKGWPWSVLCSCCCSPARRSARTGKIVELDDWWGSTQPHTHTTTHTHTHVNTNIDSHCRVSRIKLRIPHEVGGAIVALRAALEALVVEVTKEPEFIRQMDQSNEKLINVIRHVSKPTAAGLNLMSNTHRYTHTHTHTHTHTFCFVMFCSFQRSWSQALGLCSGWETVLDLQRWDASMEEEEEEATGGEDTQGEEGVTEVGEDMEVGVTEEEQEDTGEVVDMQAGVDTEGEEGDTGLGGDTEGEVGGTGEVVDMGEEGVIEEEEEEGTEEVIKVLTSQWHHHSDIISVTSSQWHHHSDITVTMIVRNQVGVLLSAVRIHVLCWGALRIWMWWCRICPTRLCFLFKVELLFDLSVSVWWIVFDYWLFVGNLNKYLTCEADCCFSFFFLNKIN